MRLMLSGVLITVLAAPAFAQNAPTTTTPSTPAPTPSPAPSPTPPPPPTTPPTPINEPPKDQPAAEEPDDDDAQAVNDDPGTQMAPEERGKKKHKAGTVEYRPREGIVLHGSKKTELLLKFVVQIVNLDSHTICPSGMTCAPDSVQIHVRRARAGFDFKLPHHMGGSFELQIKNEVLVIKNAFMTWSHKADAKYKLSFGMIKPPGGLERDGSTFDKPFPERSVVANLTHDRELGIKLTGKTSNLIYGVSVARPRAAGQDAADPEDVKPPPVGVEPEDLTKDPGIWNVSTRGAWVPSDDLSVGIAGGIRFTGDLSLGEAVSEPYEAKIFQARPSTGFQSYASGDVSKVLPHMRFMAEGGFWRDGKALDLSTLSPMNPALNPALNGHLMVLAGYVYFGYTPNGVYGKAIDTAPLLKGWEIITRVEGLTGSPGEDGGRGNMIGVTTGFSYAPYPQLRLQADIDYQHFSAHTDPSSDRQGRIWGELWAQMRL